jgi:predicted enzyme related to lactoylglutathione lyase
MSSVEPAGLRVCKATTKEVVVPSTKTHVEKVATVIIPVSDQERMVSFYVEALGLEKRVDSTFGPGYRWVEVAPVGAETTIALAPPPEGKPTGNRETGISLFADDVDALHAELKASGVDVDAEVSHMGDPVPPMFWMRDPEGNSLVVVG